MGLLEAEEEMTYWLAIKPFLKYIIPFVVGLSLGLGTAWKIQGWRYGGDRDKLVACEAANLTNQNAISNLKKDAAKGAESCEKRIKAKDDTIKKLKNIDNLRGKDEKNPDSGDAIRDALNGMWR
jgi:hypothetical protein